MKILSWNCRGLSRPAAVRSLRALIHDHAPDVLFLFETKISLSQVSATLNRLGFFLISQVASCGSSGGLALSLRGLVLILNAFSLPKTLSLHGVILIPPIPLGSSHVFMDPLTKDIGRPFGTCSLLLVTILIPFGYAQVTSMLCCLKMKKWVVGRLLSLQIQVLRAS